MTLDSIPFHVVTMHPAARLDWFPVSSRLTHHFPAHETKPVLILDMYICSLSICSSSFMEDLGITE